MPFKHKGERVKFKENKVKSFMIDSFKEAQNCVRKEVYSKSAILNLRSVGGVWPKGSF